MKRLAPTPETDSPSPAPLLAEAGQYLGADELATLRRACAFATVLTAAAGVSMKAGWLSRGGGVTGVVVGEGCELGSCLYRILGG